MLTKQVAVSGAIGKQVFFQASAAISTDVSKVTLKGFLLTPLSANAHVTIRKGNASGTVAYSARATSGGGSIPVILDHKGERFDNGMHVEVIGANALCYLYYE